MVISLLTPSQTDASTFASAAPTFAIGTSAVCTAACPSTTAWIVGLDPAAFWTRSLELFFVLSFNLKGACCASQDSCGCRRNALCKQCNQHKLQIVSVIELHQGMSRINAIGPKESSMLKTIVGADKEKGMTLCGQLHHWIALEAPEERLQVWCEILADGSFTSSSRPPLSQFIFTYNRSNHFDFKHAIHRNVTSE